MFAVSLLIVSTALLSTALPLPIPAELDVRDQPAQPPADWWTDGLEPYATYHQRYMDLDCLDKHNTSFFDDCCHPLLKTETLEANREPKCNPANLDCDGDDDDSNDDNHHHDDKPAPKAPAPKAPAPAPAPAPKDPAPAPKASTPATTPPKAPVNVEPAPPKPSPTPAPASNSNNNDDNNNNAFHLGGFGTWFTQNGVAGACGTVHKDSDKVVALDSRTYDNGKFCGQTIEITDLGSGKTFDAVVADECPTCDNPECVDMSTSLFQEFANLSVGELNIKWRFKD